MHTVEIYEPTCATPVVHAAMANTWDELTFIHWRFDPAVVQQLLPAGLTVHTFDGDAWVGLVPFMMRVRPPGLPSVPWLTEFAETNVRTYVRGPDGSPGVWFFSLDAARLGAVVVARTTYRLPYFWSKMRTIRSGSRIEYRTRRRWPKPSGSSTVIVEIGEPFAPDELTSLDHFLTARWALYTASRTGFRHARVAHKPWPLTTAHLVAIDDTLVTAAGLPSPSGEPIVHYSSSVDVRIGWPRRAAQPMRLGTTTTVPSGSWCTATLTP